MLFVVIYTRDAEFVMNPNWSVLFVQSMNSSFPPRIFQSESMVRQEEIPPRGRNRIINRNRMG